MLRLNRRGQSTAEYAIVIGLVIAAAVAMQVYVKRGIQSKVKSATDHVDVDDKITVASGQYEPYYQESDIHATRNATTSENTATGGKVVRAITGTDVSTRKGTTDVTAVVSP